MEESRARKQGCAALEGKLPAEMYGEQGKGLVTDKRLRYGESNQCVGRLIPVC